MCAHANTGLHTRAHVRTQVQAAQIPQLKDAEDLAGGRAGGVWGVHRRCVGERQRRQGLLEDAGGEDAAGHRP